jgi:hypothetical protein
VSLDRALEDPENKDKNLALKETDTGCLDDHDPNILPKI